MKEFKESHFLYFSNTIDPTTLFEFNSNPLTQASPTTDSEGTKTTLLEFQTRLDNIDRVISSENFFENHSSEVISFLEWLDRNAPLFADPLFSRELDFLDISSKLVPIYDMSDIYQRPAVVSDLPPSYRTTPPRTFLENFVPVGLIELRSQIKEDTRLLEEEIMESTEDQSNQDNIKLILTTFYRLSYFSQSLLKSFISHSVP